MYKLNKEVKGSNFVYTVTKNGEIVSQRVSKRDYIACTIDGDFYFGRLDLIGKGDHGRLIKRYQDVKANPGSEYEYYLKMDGKLSKEEYIESRLRYANERLEKLNAIAYL